MVFKGPNTTDSYPTPKLLYDTLDSEFHFDALDPCPLDNPSGVDGLTIAWPSVTFCNPPYSRLKTSKRNGLGWVEKAHIEACKGKTVVLLIPARTDTSWHHDIILANGYEVRFLRGRVKFGGAGSAPFPSMVVIMKNKPS
jgi:hypothetical protein